MAYFRVDMKCRVTNKGTCVPNPEGSHIAGRHIFVSAISADDAMEKTKRFYGNQHDTKVIRAEKISLMPPPELIKNIP